MRAPSLAKYAPNYERRGRSTNAGRKSRRTCISLATFRSDRTLVVPIAEAFEHMFARSLCEPSHVRF